MAELTGQTLGQYKLGALIGKGGMAVVYRAHQTSMARDVAIKVMAEELATNEEFVARFEREARVIAQLQHPHILPVIDFGRTEQYIYLVMRYVAGGVLSDRLVETSLTVQQVDRFLSQVSSALEYAHRQGVVHRDLKPTNVLLDEQDNTYLTDFGIAKMLAGSTSQNLTATGRVMGTPSYMAPEQWRSEPVDARTDIYSLGIILYEMLLGAQPFYAETPYGMMYKHFDTPPPLPRLINPHLPETVEHIVLRALAKQPKDRYGSALEMAEAFTAAVRTMSPDMVNRPLPRATVEDVSKATSITQERLSSGQAVYPPPTPGGAGVTQATDFAQRGSYTPAEAARPVTPAGTPAASTGYYPSIQPVEERRGGRGLLVGFVLFLLLAAAVVVVGLMVLSGGGDDENANATSTAEAVAIAGTDAVATEIGAIAGTEIAATEIAATRIAGTEIAAQTSTAQAIAEGTATGIAQATVDAVGTMTIETNMIASTEPTATEEPTATLTAAPTFTEIAVVPTDTPEPTATPTNTPDIKATAAALLALRLTQTAESWTDTPTQDIEKTVEAQLNLTLTGIAVNLTRTAESWTATPTRTPSPTNTQQPTLPPPPTVTKAPTTVPTRVPTATLVPIATAVPTRVPFPTATLVPACSMRTRLEPDEGARTTLYPDEPTRIRSGPGTGSRTLREIPPGQTFWVEDGPECADNINFWYIQGIDEDGLWNGWIGEGGGGTYWVEPYETGPVECPGAPAPRLVPGDGGRITLSPPLPSNVRSSPTANEDNRIGQMQPGETFEVVSGPVCDEDRGWRWWQIRNFNIEGWVAEGPIGEYWVEPWTYP